MNHQELIQIFKQMISIPSVNPPGLEQEMGKFILKLLDQANIKREVVPISPNRFSIIATLPGSTEEGRIFTGHMDVVPVSPKEEKRWKTKAFEPTLQDGALYGRGTADMKGGLAAGLCAMIAIKEQGMIPKKDIHFVATVDEEDFMKGSKAAVCHPLLKNAKEVVVMEPTNFTCCHIGRGRTYGTLTIQGATSHGSGGVSQGNAILMAMNIIQKMMATPLDVHPQYGPSFWQPVSIHAGVEPCVVPDECVVKIDARLHPFHHPKDLWATLERLLEKEKVNEQTTLDIIDARPGFYTDDNHPLLSEAKKALENQHLPWEKGVFMGTTDGHIFHQHGRDVIILGPGDLSVVHRENEHLLIKDLENAYDLYRDMML